jgi:hypothetical protein
MFGRQTLFKIGIVQGTARLLHCAEEQHLNLTYAEEEP